jgi:hypothetical protein
MSKKGESISMSVIIIAAIALLVLVVLAVLVLRAGTGVGTGTSCTGVGGRCQADSGDLLDPCGNPNLQRDIAKSGKIGGCQEGDVCCVAVTRNPDE